MVQKLVLTIALCIASSVAKSPGTLIVGGEDAARNQFPWHVTLWVFPKWEPPRFCSGVLISLDVVLTSVSCVSNTELPIIVRAGDYSISDSTKGMEQMLVSEQIILHENYNSAGKQENDIALIKFSEKFNQTVGVKQIRLPTENFNPDLSEYGIATGWEAYLGDVPVKDKLQKANLKIFRRADCADLVDLSDGDFCTLDAKGGLQSDKGGPLICSENQEVLCGIMTKSISEVGENKEILGLYINVSFYLEWIHSNAIIEPPTDISAAVSAKMPYGLVLTLVSISVYVSKSI